MVTYTSHNQAWKDFVSIPTQNNQGRMRWHPASGLGVTKSSLCRKEVKSARVLSPHLMPHSSNSAFFLFLCCYSDGCWTRIPKSGCDSNILISAPRKIQMYQPTPETWHKTSWESHVWAALRVTYGFREGRVGRKNHCSSEAGAHRMIFKPVSQLLLPPTSIKPP